MGIIIPDKAILGIKMLILGAVMPKKRTFSEYTREAAILLGQLIKLGRQNRRWSTDELAERAGISRRTLQKIERGDPACTLGLVFEAAALVGVPLFESDSRSLAHQIARTSEMLALMPKKIRVGEKAVDDDF